jgi:hypothetical protein
VIPVPNHGEGRGYRAGAVDIRAETPRWLPMYDIHIFD